MYDIIMKRSIFPKKFAADVNKHSDTLRQELNGIHGKRVLELATGSGSATSFIGNDNTYVGTDISPGLLRKALKKFLSAGFESPEFYVSRSEDLPFDDESFDLVFCQDMEIFNVFFRPGNYFLDEPLEIVCHSLFPQTAHKIVFQASCQCLRDGAFFCPGQVSADYYSRSNGKDFVFTCLALGLGMQERHFR